MNVRLLLAMSLFPLCLSAQSPKRITVDPEGHGQYRTVQEAVDKASDKGTILLIAPGTYHEKVSITKPNISLVGMGSDPTDTTITWGDSAKSSGSTFTSGTVTVGADGFGAENLSIVNTWWQDHIASEDRSQAVALQMESDRAVLDRVRLISGQDTLYANSHACRGELSAFCRADRQYFSDCFIEGNVDYIFGDAKAVFDHCELHSRPGSGVMITAQSRHSTLEDSGYYMLHCHITGLDQGNRISLGRPWRDYATVLFYDTQMDQKIEAAGWSEWGGRLKTSTYREYKSHGPGVNNGARSVTYPPLSPELESHLSSRALLGSTDRWDPEAEVQRLRQIR